MTKNIEHHHFYSSCGEECGIKEMSIPYHSTDKKVDGKSNKNFTTKTSDIALVILPKVISARIPSSLTRNLKAVLLKDGNKVVVMGRVDIF